MAWENHLAKAQNKTGVAIFIRFKVIEPAWTRFAVTTGGFIHSGDPWVLPNTTTEVAGGTWSEWLDLSRYPWHSRINRSGGALEVAVEKFIGEGLKFRKLVSFFTSQT